MKFRKKPVVIEAVQLRMDDLDGLFNFVKVGHLSDGKPELLYLDHTVCLRIPTLEGVMTAVSGDWIIRGVKGELYPCKPEIFNVTYEPVVEG